ncbi:transposase [Cognataquiflexum aquatile]|uniref:transposase n=1 Tax=Cognataquiflexum aquatile TaxID=2249427 RepID=UPI001300367E|nr:transposase [Cognataquiflexum aquatile]
MAEKYKNKYRTESFRAKWWDYTWNAAYFVTICTLNRQHYFGKVSNGKMILSGAGVLADVFWHEIKNHHKYVELDAFVVMPNHIHGILIINKPNEKREEEKNDFGKEDQRKEENGNNYSRYQEENEDSLYREEDGDSIYREEDGDSRNKDKEGDSRNLDKEGDSRNLDKEGDSCTVVACNDSTEFSQHMAAISPKKDSLPSILRSYKSAVTKHANRLGFEFGWQSKYHDHIIRDEAAYQRIAQYIENNPSKWKEDGFF